jgi:hypothetical protein
LPLCISGDFWSGSLVRGVEKAHRDKVFL